MAIDWEYYKKKAKKIDDENYRRNISNSDIAPVRSQTPTSTTEDSKWFQKSALFNDGWNKGDVSKTVKASGTDVAENAGAGFIGTGEKIVDFLAWLGTAMNGQQMQTAAQNEMIFNTITGKDIDGKTTLEKYNTWQKEAEKGTEEFIKKDLYDESAIAKKIITDPLEQKWGINVETDSVFGQKSDELAQSAGQLGASVLANVIAPGSGLAMSGINAFGSEMESALNQGATYNEAAFSSMVSAGAEMLTEKLTGGIKFGGKALDDALTSKITSRISSGVVRKLADMGMDAAGEGFEEVLSGTMSAIGQKLSYMSDKEFTELFSVQDAWDSFIGGAVLGGFSGVSKNVKAKIKGIDSVTGLDKSEQAVFEKVYNDRIAEAKKDGKKLSGKNKSNIFNSVMNDLERGRIGIDTIESVLGGETYKQYQSAVEKDNQMKELQKEYDTLYRMKNGEKSDEQIDRQAELKQQLEEYRNTSKLTEIKDQLSSEVSELAKSGKLVESYNEKSRRSQAYEADLTQYDTKAQETVKRAIDSGILNNTNRTHEFVDLIAKLSADKGVLFDFTNNEKLKASGFAIEGKQVNGYVQGNNIAINIDSTSALNKVVGHEITHVLEGTELYTELANAVKELATTKGEYDSKLQSITKLYEGVEDANIENELTADLVGEYLFTDSDFINRLSVEKPTLFQKIFDEIKYLYKTATAGSKEAKQLEKVKKTFEEAYRQKNNTATEGGVKYSMAGVKSKTYDFSALEQAIRLEDVGKATSEEIRQQTGWFRGYDGEWRYEINDKDMKIKDVDITSGETKLGDVLEHQELFDAYPELKDVTISAFPSMFRPDTNGYYNKIDNEISLADYFLVNTKVEKELADIKKNPEYLSYKESIEKAAEVHGVKRLELANEFKEIKNTNEYQTYIDDYFNCSSPEQAQEVINKWINTEAGKRYEEIKSELSRMDKENPQTKIEKEFRDSEIGKRYYELLKNIDVSEITNNPRTRSTLIHEIQHAIQHIERFANGSSVEYWAKAPVESKLGTLAYAEDIRKKYGEKILSSASPEFIQAFREYNRGDIEYSDIENGNFTEEELDMLWDYDEADREVAYLLEHKGRTDEDLYYSTAGEVEARDTSKRLDYTGEQRKNTRPDIDRTDVVFAENSGIGYSSKEYSYENLVSKSNMKVSAVDDSIKYDSSKSTRKSIIDSAVKNVKSVGYTNEHGNGVVKVRDIDTDVVVSRKSIEHGLDRRLSINGAVALNIGNILENSIKINELVPSNENAKSSYVLIGAAQNKNNDIFIVRSVVNSFSNELDKVDVLYAVNTKKESAVLNEPALTDEPLRITDSTISISDLLDYVNKYFPDILPEDVLKHYGHTSRPEGVLGESALFSLSNTNEDIAPVGNNVYGENIKLQTASAEDIAPIGENVVRKTTQTESVIKKQTSPEIDLFVKPNKTVDTEQTATPEDAIPVEQSAETTETVEEKPKSKRLERAIRKIDTQLEQDKADLSEDFQQKKAELEKALENKSTYISDKSLSLYKELQNLRKGVRASNDLAYFLDLGYEWKDLKSTLLKVHKWPDTVLNTESEIESTVREAIGRDFDEKSYELDDLDTEYQKQLENLEKKAEEKRKKAGIAEQRRVKVQEYRTQMDDLIGDTTTWKDKKLGVQYQINTLRRNLRDIVRDKSGKRDLDKADAIYDELQGRYNHNEAELNREANRIKKVYADMKINKVEDQYIQMLGEYRHNPDTKLTLEEMQEFLEKNRDKIDEAKVDKVIDLARETYDSLFGRVNAVLKEQGMREIPYRLGYFPHFTEEKQGRLAKLLNWKTHKTDIPTDIAGLTEQFNPNRSWQSFNKQRTGDDTDYSFTKGLDTYVQGALDWIYHIDDIQKRRAFENHIRYVHSEKGIQEKIDAIHNSEEYDADEMQEQIDAVFKEAGNPLNNFVTDFRTQTNTLAGKKSSMDRNMEAMLSRDVYSTMTNISNRVTANMVVGSVSSALTNFIPITQSWGEVSPISSIKAMKDTIKSAVRDDGTIDKSDFLTNRLKKSENLYQTTWDKVIDKAGAMMEIIDSFTSQTVWRSKYLENISNGMSENAAIKNADQFAENVLAGRSRGNNPTIFDSKNPLIKTLTAFQLEVNNQYGYMFKDMPQDLKNKSIGKLVKGYGTMFLGAYAYNALYSALAGRDAAFDPLSIIDDLLKDLFGDDEEEPADIIMNLTDNVLEELPFVGGLIGGGRIPISSALPYDDGIYGTFEGFVTDVTEGNWKHLAKEIGESFVSYLLLPAGGGQIKKSIQGLQMFDDDFPIAGSYTDSGKLRFSVEETPGNIAQAAVFGQYASKTARQYFDDEHAPLSDKQTKELVDIQVSMEEYWEYQKGLKKLGEDATLAEKVDYIADLEEFDTWQKNIMANNLTTRKEPIDLTGYDAIGDFEEFDYAMKNPEKYAISKAVGGYENYIKYSERLGNITAEKDKNGNAVSGSRKKKVARYINSLDIEFGEKMILYRSQYKSDDTYNAQIVEYLNGRDDITHQDKITILTELGFKVSDDGKVRW